MVCESLRMQRAELAGLRTILVGPADAPVMLVLLHGFGAPGEDLVPLSQAILAPARYAFPAAPLALGGMYGDARAWWHLDLAKLEHDLASGTPRDRSAEVPDGLAEARAKVIAMIDALDLPAGTKLVLGGFSQGAMLALDVALHRTTPVDGAGLPRAGSAAEGRRGSIDGLILMSGTLIAASEWAPRMAQLAGVPVVMSHGKRDALLPFSIAETLRDQLRAAGATVDWQPFSGGHEIPALVLDAVSAFVRARAAS
jgi:phospholipase/carboxylesterase